MDESLNAWRFPDNRYLQENGLDTSDMETFKKDPLSSLAREICQNSIDASAGDAPVRVEFSFFEINRDKIPGIEDLAEQIQACYEYKKDSAKEGKALKALVQAISKDTIKCLRISDYNTTGVTGGITNTKGTPFYNLTKGSGVSDKLGASGGSKGIGKFASFVVSTTNTVFYSTNADDNSKAHIGISKLRSIPYEGDDELLTFGIGYFGRDDKNHPILEELCLDEDYCRKDDEYGTDVYIVGFNDNKRWQSNIAAKILDSFMVAILYDKLEVSVGDEFEITSDTVKDIIYGETFEKERTKTELKDIRAQYELLTESENDVSFAELTVAENNKIKIYVKQYSALEEGSASKQCVMVRFPYMKITHITTGAFIPYSALCIIEDNDLNEKLRIIENPQHTDWEIKRLNEFPEEKKETRALKNELETTVKEYINSILKQSTGEKTDMEGAGEYLPSQEDAGDGKGNSLTSDQVIVNPISRMKAQNPKTVKAGEKGESYEFAEGDVDGHGEDGRKPKKKKKKKTNPNPEPKGEPKDQDGIGKGKDPVLKKTPLSGIRFRSIVADKKNEKYDCIFTSEYDEGNCDFCIRMCGEATDKYPMEILEATINGNPCEIEDGKIVGLKIEKGKIYKISYSVHNDGMFSSEVIMNAYR